MSRTEIYYYSGTGNSLHVARELRKLIPDTELIPILKFQDGGTVRSSAEKVGFVFPIYFTSIPAPMRKFIERIDLTSANYIFYAATRIGTFTIAFPLMRKLLKKKGKKLDSHILLNMTSNSPTGLKPGKGSPKWVKNIAIEEVRRRDMEIRPDMERFSRAVMNKEPYPDPSFPNPLRYIAFKVLYPLTRFEGSEVGYYVDDTCIGCGTCEEVCLSNKVKLVNGKPVWQDDVQCYYCFACFNLCPQQAILVKNKYDTKAGRFHHPDVTMEDIASQKDR